MLQLDFETEAIDFGAAELPVPVGCAITYPDGHSEYYSWAHPEGNNCDKEEFWAVLLSIWDQPLCTHNGGVFDIEVARQHFDLPERDPLLTEDTMLLAYLANPHARSLKLKDLAEDLLGMPPEEQRDLQDWILANVPECKKREKTGAYISKAPASLVAPYAMADNRMSHGLLEYYSGVRDDMREAYDRERKLCPILADIKRRGVRVDVKSLLADYKIAQQKLHDVSDTIRAHLKQGSEFDPSKDAQLGKALLDLGYGGFLTTPTGKTSMSRPSLEKALASDPKLLDMLNTRSVYDTLLSTFMGPWLQLVVKNHGRIHPEYNQTRNEQGYGTRTGRLSSSHPNGQNIPADLGLDCWGDPFPDMRTYLLPEEGEVWVCGDIKNQEPRLTAHYEGGQFLEAFIDDPELDPYIFVRDTCSLAQTKDGRHEAKQILLGLIYAMGIGALAERLGCSTEYASSLKNIIKGALPDVVELDADCKRRFSKGLPIRTLGGRLYYCEPPTNGRTWAYKALNTLIQGSAADQTKEALVWIKPELDKIGARILGTVHDEISVSCKPQHVDRVKTLLHLAVNQLKCDCPMIVEVGVGNNWSEAKL